MQVVPLFDLHFGLGSEAEIIHRGQSFTPPGTGQMNRLDHAQSLIATGACCAADDWPKRQAKTQPGLDWAQAEVARLNARRR